VVLTASTPGVTNSVMAPAFNVVPGAPNKLVLTGPQRFWKDHLGEVYGQLVHEAKSLDPVARDMEAMIASSQRFVSGDVRVELRQGLVRVTGVQSPYSLMAVQKTAYGEGTSLWSGADARGFCLIHGIPTFLAHRAQEG
jgi:argininosuccinate synthase